MNETKNMIKGNHFLIRFMVWIFTLKVDELTAYSPENVNCTKVQILQGITNLACH